MLFRKKIEPACAYCTRGSGITELEVVCKKRGIVEPWESCKSFRYDPYKREPPHPPKLRRVDFAELILTTEPVHIAPETILSVDLRQESANPDTTYNNSGGWERLK